MPGLLEIVISMMVHVCITESQKSVNIYRHPVTPLNPPCEATNLMGFVISTVCPVKIKTTTSDLHVLQILHFQFAVNQLDQVSELIFRNGLVK